MIEDNSQIDALDDEPKIINKIADDIKEITRPLTIEEVKKVLGITVKHDEANKLITFLCMLSTYTEESQLNISFRAPSSTGKSHIPIELSEFFPPEDVKKIGYSSPTSFYHDGTWNEETKQLILDLERKILIFLDQPHDELLKRLRPLLSHDQKELLYKITDKGERKGLRTKNVIIRGYPSVIFCTGSLRMDEQEGTRNIVLSPETSQAKIGEAIALNAKRKGNPLEYRSMLDSSIGRKRLRQRIGLIKEEKIRYIIINNVEEIADRFIKENPRLKPRHTRDFGRLIAFIQMFALLNLWHRKKTPQNDIYANEEDIRNGFELYSQIAESQELGLSPYVYKIFLEVITPLYKECSRGLTKKEVMNRYYDIYGRPIPEWVFKKDIIPALESSGLIYQEEDPNDKRRMLIFLTKPPNTSLPYPKNSLF